MQTASVWSSETARRAIPRVSSSLRDDPVSVKCQGMSQRRPRTTTTEPCEMGWETAGRDRMQEGEKTGLLSIHLNRLSREADFEAVFVQLRFYSSALPCMLTRVYDNLTRWWHALQATKMEAWKYQRSCMFPPPPVTFLSNPPPPELFPSQSLILHPSSPPPLPTSASSISALNDAERGGL